MLILNANENNIIQVNFPASQFGKLSDMRYRLYQIVSSVPSVIQTFTNIGVYELGAGAYGISLSLSKGLYSIEWEIQNTPYKANEEINVLDNLYDFINTKVDEAAGKYIGVFT